MATPQYGLPKPHCAHKRRLWWLPALMLIFGLAASSWITQSIAQAYRYHPALGAPAFGRLYPPWEWAIWRAQHADTQGIMAQAVSEGQLIFLVPMALCLLWAMTYARKPKGSADLHGSAHWATTEDVVRAGLLTQASAGRVSGFLRALLPVTVRANDAGVQVGGWERKTLLKTRPLPLRHNGPEHILVFAPTRSGKGVSIVIPTLLTWSESALILDIKGENWAKTAGYLRSAGHSVLRLDLSDASGGSARYNGLEEICLYSPQAISDAQNAASVILDPDGAGLKDYWNKAAFSFLSGAILHCMITVRHAQAREASLHDVSCMLADENRNIQELFSEMIVTDHARLLSEMYPEQKADFTALHTFIASAGREMAQKADNECSGVVSTTVSPLAIYRDPVVAMNTSCCDFHIHDLMNRAQPVSLYFVISPNDLNRLKPVVRFILNLFLSRLTRRMEFTKDAGRKTRAHRLLLLLDEFTSLGNLEIFERALAFMAGYGLKALLIVQDLQQLRKAYSKDESIMSNCHIRVAFAPNHVETADLLSRMTGKTTIVEQKIALSGARAGRLKNASLSVSETARPLLTPDECMRLPGMIKDAHDRVKGGGDMLLFAAGCPPVYCKQMLYFQDPVFAARSRIPPPLESDRLVDQSETKATMPPKPDVKISYAEALAKLRSEYADKTS